MMTVLIAGASSGLGLHTAQQLNAAGMQVIAGARSFTAKEGESDGIYKIGLDVRDPESVERFVRMAVDRYGTPDAIICAQGLLNLCAAAEYKKNKGKSSCSRPLTGCSVFPSRADILPVNTLSKDTPSASAWKRLRKESQYALLHRETIRADKNSTAGTVPPIVRKVLIISAI